MQSEVRTISVLQLILICFFCRRILVNQDGSSTKPEDVKHSFVSLVETHFVCRCPELNKQSEETDALNFREDNDPYLLPDAVDIYGKMELRFCYVVKFHAVDCRVRKSGKHVAKTKA